MSDEPLTPKVAVQAKKILELLESPEAQRNPRYYAVQSLIGAIFSLNDALTAADTVSLCHIAGDLEGADRNRIISFEMRAASYQYLAQWARAELGVDDGTT